MPQTREEISANLAERLCWQVARRDHTRVARRLYRKELYEALSSDAKRVIRTVREVLGR